MFKLVYIWLTLLFQAALYADNEAAYGFMDLETVFSQRVTDIGVAKINTAIQQTLDEYNRVADAMIGNLAEDTTDIKRLYTQGSGGTLQPITELGRPKPTLDAGQYEIGFYLERAGDAFATDRESRAAMTVKDINDATAKATRKDADWMIRHALAHLLVNVPFTFKDKKLGNVTVQSLANNDAVKYVKKSGATATADHYLAQAAAIDDANNPFEAAYDLLKGYPGHQGATIVSFVSGSLMATTKGLSDFVSVVDPDLRPGANQAVIVADGRPFQIFGDMVEGKASNQWIVRWDRLPSGYIFHLLIGGGVDKPLARRQKEEASLRGFFKEMANIDGNLMVEAMIRICGFGAQNRVAAAVTYVGGGAYVIPAEFPELPLAI